MLQSSMARRDRRRHIDPGRRIWFLRREQFNRPAAPEGKMTSMKDREQGFERKFAMDEEQRFKASARRNRQLGLWAAEKLGKSGADAEAYAKEVVVADFVEA